MESAHQLKDQVKIQVEFKVEAGLTILRRTSEEFGNTKSTTFQVSGDVLRFLFASPEIVWAAHFLAACCSFTHAH